MPRMRLTTLVAGLLLSAAVTAGTVPARADEVVVFAAASLTNALGDVAARFTAHTGHQVVASYAASSALARQIEQGAPAQVFASADLKWMDYLVGRKLIDPASRSHLLGNSLVLVAPIDSSLAPMPLDAATDLVKLADGGRIATGNPDSVPVGLYFRKAMERTGQWAALEPHVARADSVRAALALVERGEALLGVVYGTDAAISSKVKVIGSFPESMHDPIVYPFALVAGQETPAARAFLAFVQSEEARAAFVRFGFRINGNQIN